MMSLYRLAWFPPEKVTTWFLEKGPQSSIDDEVASIMVVNK